MRALKHRDHEAAEIVSARSGPRLADGSEAPGRNLVLEQHRLLEAGFAPVEVQPYPGAVKLGILLGGSVLMWAGVIATGAQLVNALHR